MHFDDSPAMLIGYMGICVARPTNSADDLHGKIVSKKNERRNGLLIHDFGLVPRAAHRVTGTLHTA